MNIYIISHDSKKFSFLVRIRFLHIITNMFIQIDQLAIISGQNYIKNFYYCSLIYLSLHVRLIIC